MAYHLKYGHKKYGDRNYDNALLTMCSGFRASNLSGCQHYDDYKM